MFQVPSSEFQVPSSKPRVAILKPGIGVLTFGIRNSNRSNVQVPDFSSTFQVPRPTFQVARFKLHVPRFNCHVARFTFQVSSIKFRIPSPECHVPRPTFLVAISGFGFQVPSPTFPLSRGDKRIDFESHVSNSNPGVGNLRCGIAIVKPGGGGFECGFWCSNRWTGNCQSEKCHVDCGPTDLELREWRLQLGILKWESKLGTSNFKIDPIGPGSKP